MKLNLKAIVKQDINKIHNFFYIFYSKNLEKKSPRRNI